jgi:hypothetical protein
MVMIVVVAYVVTIYTDIVVSVSTTVPYLTRNYLLSSTKVAATAQGDFSPVYCKRRMLTLVSADGVRGGISWDAHGRKGRP